MTLPPLRDEQARLDIVTRSFLDFRDRGDLAALGRVFDALAPQLLSLGLHLCGNAADAEDTLPATFVVAMRKAQVFDVAQSLAPWLAGILAGEARNLKRRAGRRRTAHLDDVSGDGADPATVAERRELVQRLRTKIDSLPESQRQALLLQLEYGLQPAQIAEVLAVPPGTVRMRLHRGLQTLRRLLPAGLAAWVFGALPARGLAAVRLAVLAEGKKVVTAGRVATTAAVTLGGLLLMKQVLFVVGLVAMALLIWLTAPWADSLTAPVRGNGVDGAAQAAVNAPADSASSPVLEPAARVALAMPAPSGSVLVRVRFEGTDEPVAGVEVSLFRLPPAERYGASLMTDERGEARFENAPAGSLQFSWSPGWFAKVKIGEGRYAMVRTPELYVDVRADAETLVTHTLRRGGVVTGRTVDETGQVIGCAEILTTSTLDMAHRDSSAWRHAGRSAADGSFRVQLIHNERGIAAMLEGLAPSSTHGLDADVDREVSTTLVLSRVRGGVTGIVREGDGSPVAGAKVTLFGWWRSSRSPTGEVLWDVPARKVATDEHGRFTFLDVGCGRTQVRVETVSLWSVQADITVEDGRTVVQDLVLPADAATLRCVVRDHAGAPTADALVRVASDHYRIERRTGADGTCTFERLGPWPAEVRATRQGVGTATQTISLAGRRQHECELQLVPTPSIRGRLLAEGGGTLAGWTITAIDEEWQKTAARSSAAEIDGTSAHDGTFELADLAPHPYRLLGLPPAGERELGRVMLGEHARPGPQQQTFTVPRTALPSASVTGIVHGTDGQPYARAVVLLVRCDAQPDEWGIGRETGTDGTFTFGSLRPGRYRLEVQADEPVADPLPEIELAPQERRDLGILRLKPATRLAVRVLDAFGAPWRHKLPQVEVERLHADGSAQGRGGFVAVDGLLRSPSLLPGRVRLTLHDHQLFAWPVETELVEGLQTVVELRVQSGVVQRLRFEFPAGVASLRVQATDSQGRTLPLLAKALSGLPRIEMSLSLLADVWYVTAEDNLGNRYAGKVEVRDLTPERQVASIPIPLAK